MKLVFDFDVLLLDIEGTTTPISFVRDTLFPYARKRLPSFLESCWGDPMLDDSLLELHKQHARDLADGVEDLPPFTVTLLGTVAERKEVLVYLLWLMDLDRKTTGLKMLQGEIWKDGYASGEIKGEIFDDVPEVFSALQAQGIPIYIYSSGSVQAQKLLFGQTTEGNLLPYLSGYFDTTTGSKKASESYQIIAKELGALPSRILFVTDLLSEAQAARKSGMQAMIMERPGNPPQSPHIFPILKSLRPLTHRSAPFVS